MDDPNKVNKELLKELRKFRKERGLADRLAGSQANLTFAEAMGTLICALLIGLGWALVVFF